MAQLVGRTVEKEILDTVLASNEAELVALYGRRRVGKTHLIREHLGPRADLFVEVFGDRIGRSTSAGIGVTTLSGNNVFEMVTVVETRHPAPEVDDED